MHYDIATRGVSPLYPLFLAFRTAPICKLLYAYLCSHSSGAKTHSGVPGQRMLGHVRPRGHQRHGNRYPRAKSPVNADMQTAHRRTPANLCAAASALSDFVHQKTRHQQGRSLIHQRSHCTCKMVEIWTPSRERMHQWSPHPRHATFLAMVPFLGPAPIGLWLEAANLRGCQ